MQAAGRTKLRFDIEVYEDAQVLYNRDPRPGWAAMEAELADKHPEGSPSEGALRKWEKLGVITKEPEDAPWVFGEGDPEDDALLLPVIRLDLAISVATAERDAAVEAVYARYQAAQDDLIREVFGDKGDDVVRVVHEAARQWTEEELEEVEDDLLRDVRAPWSPSRRVARWIVRIRRAAPDWGDVWRIMDLARFAARGDVALVERVLALTPWLDDGQMLERAVKLGLLPRDALQFARGRDRLEGFLESWARLVEMSVADAERQASLALEALRAKAAAKR